MVSIGTIEEEILNLERRDTSHAVCERPAWPYIVRDHPKKPAADDTAAGQRTTDELTGSEFLKAASRVDYAALMGILDNHMSCIKAVCRKSTTPSCRRSTRHGSNYLSNGVNYLSHT